MDTDSTRWLKLRSGSDIRATETQLTDDTCEKIGYAFAVMLAERLRTTPDQLAIAVGRDGRDSGRRVLSALIRGITAADSDVIDGGLCALPALFDMAVRDAEPVSGAVMVTSDEDQPGRTGFKFITSKGGLAEADVALMLRMAAASEVPERLVTRLNPMEGYRDYLKARAAELLADDALKPLLGLYLVVDVRTGGGAFFAGLMEDLGADVERLGEGDPRDLEAAVPAYGADMGFRFTPDSSRATIVDPAGSPVDGNRLIAMMSAMLLEKKPGATIVTDSVTSTGLSAFIAEWGGVHYRFKRGYRSVIEEAVRLNAETIDCPLAIETTGHAAFRENHFLDDGIYLALRIACEALDRKREGQTVFSLIDGLAEPVEALSLRLNILDGEDPAAACQEVVEIILSHTLEDPAWQMAPDSREGVRITFNLDGGVNNAWFQLRMSVHDPIMVLNAESDVPGGVKRILRALYELLKGTELIDMEPLRAAIEG